MDETIDVGIERLRDGLAACPWCPDVEAIADDLIAACLGDRPTDDDTALLVVAVEQASRVRSAVRRRRQTTMLTIRPGTTMTFLGVAPASAATTLASASAAASTTSTGLSAATVIA